MADFDVPIDEKTFEGSGSLAGDLKNLIKQLLTSEEVGSSVQDLYNYLHKHQLDIESACKKNGWAQKGGQDFAHSLERAIMFSHEYLTNFPKQTKKELFDSIIESSQEILFFLNNES